MILSFRSKPICAPDRFLLTKPNTSCTIEMRASLRSDGVPRKNCDLVVQLYRGHYTRFAFSRRTASFARNFEIPSINLTGTGSESGKRIVPLLTLYDAS
jgi:hypothetical protein